MSTAIAGLEDLSTMELMALARAKRAEAREHAPLDKSTPRLEWQKVAWALVSGKGWNAAWGPRPTREPHLVCVVSANRSGKSVFGGQVLAGAAEGHLQRFPRPGESWGGMPSLKDSVAVQRDHVANFVPKGSEWSPGVAHFAAQSECRTPSGGLIRLKAYQQGRESWQGGKCQVIVLDEQPPDDVVNEARMRLIDEDGLMLAIFTPLKGVQSILYKQAQEPWLDFARQAPKTDAPPCAICGHDNSGPRWGEVSPGVWVIAVGTRDNVKSRDGFLPDAVIDREERDLVAQGRTLEARVRYHGEWLDVSEDRLIPVELLREWSEPPAGGYADVVAWIDPAYSAKTSNCRSSIAVAGRRGAGTIDLIESHGGHWQADERERQCLDVLARHGDPNTYVQRVGGDMEFASALNAALIRAGRRACVMPWPDKGPVPDKVSRANRFSPMVVSGQVRIRPEHREVKAQAGVFSAAYLKANGVCDDLDAAMGACLRLVEGGIAAGFDAALRASESPIGTTFDDWDGVGRSIEDWQYDGDVMGEVD